MNLSIPQKQVWGALLVVQILILWVCISLNPVYAIGVVIGIGCLFYLLCGSNQLPKAILLIIVVSSIMLPTSRKFLFRAEELPFIFVIVFFLLNRLLGNKSNGKIGPTGWWLVLFLGAVVLGAVTGIFNGRTFRDVGEDLIVYFYYLMFFVVIEADLDERWIKYFIYAIIVSTFIVSLEYIGILRIYQGKVRCATDQQHIFNISIPLIVSWLLYEKRNIVRIFLVLLLLLMGIAVFLTLTRMLWASVPLSILLVLFLYLCRKKASLRQFLYTGIGVVIVSLFVFLPTKELLTRQVTLKHAVQYRANTFKRLKLDPSLLGRLELASYVLPRVRKHPIIGTGLGDMVFYKITSTWAGITYSPTEGYILGVPPPKSRAPIKWLDISYLNVLWKTGIIGLFFFIGLYVVFIKRCLFVFKNATNDFEKWSSLGIFVGFTSLLAIGFLSAILVGYRFNFTWAVLMGIIELQAQRIEKNKIVCNSVL